MSNQEIIHDDCLVAMSKMDDSSIDVVVTSPPYNLGIKYNSYKDTRDQVDYYTWLSEVFSEISRLLKNDGSFFLNIGSTSVNPWLAYEVAKVAESVGFILQNSIIWVKSVSVGETTHGHFKPINSERFLNNTYENLFHFSKTGKVSLDRKAPGVPYMHKSNISRFGEDGRQDKRCKGNVWFIPYETIVSREKDRGGHPATYPVKLAEDCISLHGGGKVLDPFVGTGTTLLAAKNLDCDAIGIEMDEDYISISKNRLE